MLRIQVFALTFMGIAAMPVLDRAYAEGFPDLPENVTSFGAAIAGNELYVYGGHTGRAHTYDDHSQAHTLRRLNLDDPKEWESLATGPRLQGLAMVADGDVLYRLGGFTAKNAVGEEHDLWSQAGVARFEPTKGEWTDVSPLPEPRSSFDAVVMDGKLYVVGGWALQGGSDATWHKTAYVMDLANEPPRWKALPDPPFRRRALSLAAHDGKLYAIGGMQPSGKPTTRVDVFDPETGKWSVGPSINGDPLEGFGSSSFAQAGHLYVSTLRGNLQRLSSDGETWETVRKLENARFFHRMLPLGDDELLMVGGADMEIGKFPELDVIRVD